MPTALITGITGQDGAYLAHLLLHKGYMVWGACRVPDSHQHGALIALGIQDQVRMAALDLQDDASLARLIETSAPDEIYHLASQTSVARSFEAPLETGEISGLGTVRLLQAMREKKPDARFFQASSSEIFGQAEASPQSESTPLRPQNPYAAAKAYAHWMTVSYREAFGCHASCGILFNHESPLRGEQFVTRKVAMGAARIKAGLQTEMALGNLDVQRDWGFAGDYIEAMYLMLQQQQPGDYVIATGKLHSLREFVALAFEAVGLDYQQHVYCDAAFVRPTETTTMVGDVGKIRERLGWTSRVSFERLIQLLVEAELKRVRGEDETIQYWTE